MELEIDHFIAWKKIADRLKQLKVTEAKARKTLCAVLFDGDEGEFIKRIELNGYAIKGTSKVSRRLDEGILHAIHDELSDADKDAVRFKPVLNLRAYRQLLSNSVLHEAVTESPAMPTLTVERIQ